MRITFTLFSVLLFSAVADAQKITGIWRGYFTSTSLAAREMPEERYKYEVQIEQLSNNSIKGVTYSYKTTVFYGKAALTGIITLPSKSLILRETRLVDIKITDRSEPCLMTCYLDYTRIGKLEVLEGTFISTDVSGKRDCGSGKIYLEKVPVSEFKKEDFLVKKNAEPSQKPAPKINLPSPSSKNDHRDNMAVKPITSHQNTQSSPVKPNTATVKPRVTPPATHSATQNKTNNTGTSKNNTVKKDEKNKPAQIQKPVEKSKEEPIISNKEQATVIPSIVESQPKRIPVPKVLTERENNLVRTINTSEPELVVSLYDNGTIDNDTISVYHNNQLVISNKKLTYSPLTVKIHCSKTENRHELVVVAENLGDIPPNTALMVVTTPNGGRERYEIFLASTETRNAKVVINYVPKD